MTHFNEMGPADEMTAAERSAAYREYRAERSQRDAARTLDPIVTIRKNGTWEMQWRSDQQVAPVNRAILESLFREHNAYVADHPKRQMEFVRRDGSVTTERPAAAPTGARAVLERLDALESQLTTAVGLLGARIEFLESQRLTKAVTCPKCSSSWGALAPASPIPLTIACPFCTTSFTV